MSDGVHSANTAFGRWPTVRPVTAAEGAVHTAPPGGTGQVTRS